MDRNKKLKYNTLTSGINQLLNVVYGLVVPQMIILYYGSSVNGLSNSISNFLSIIAVCDCGVSTVIQSALYRPLANNEERSISEILSAANNFFKVIFWILLVYNILLVCFYPILVDNEYDYFFTASLVAAIGISSFAQYYFGIVDNILLQAHQKAYISESFQSVSLIIIIVVSVIEIKLGLSIQIVKLSTSLIFLLRPIFLRWYINCHYSIRRNISYNNNPISQKWNGLAQHIAAIVLNSTPVLVLTLFSNLYNVSIYAVYAMIVLGVKSLFLSLTNGIRPYIGELWVKQDHNNLSHVFDWSEWIIHTSTIIVFGVTMVLIVPFIKVYTIEVTDANYVVPAFAVIFTMAHALHSLRLPYNIMILACNHYKQTQRNYIEAALINIVVSIMSVIFGGLIGVAIGTFVALLYQTIWMAWYCSRNFIRRPMYYFIKQTIVDVFILMIATFGVQFFDLTEPRYLMWVFLAIKVSIVFVVVSTVVNLFFYKSKVKTLINRII